MGPRWGRASRFFGQDDRHQAGNCTTVNLPHTIADDTFTITLQPPSDSGFQSVAVAQQRLDNTNLSAAEGNQQKQFYCEGGDQQLWNFRPVSEVAGTFTVVNQQTGKCLAVNGSSTADGAPVPGCARCAATETTYVCVEESLAVTPGRGLGANASNSHLGPIRA